MIASIRSGQLSLRPKHDSGWYDYQIWALEPLVAPDRAPEMKHLEFSVNYRKQLVELFKGLFALSRETHIDQVPPQSTGAGYGGNGNQVFIPLQLSAEPLASFYLRRAISYSFLRHVLEKAFGADALLRMHRLTPDGRSSKCIAEEVNQLEGLFSGAYLVVSRELGVPSSALDKLDGKPIPEANAQAFRLWAKVAKADPDLSVDGRMMVPIFYDIGRKKTKVLAFLGWATNELIVSFKREPTVLSAEYIPRKKVRPEAVFMSGEFEMYFPVTAEIYVDKVLDRQEFRGLCDRQRSPLKILRTLTESGDP
jgi:hypothetical protein